ncbi:hypothetical protein [Dactylosporangium sp. NPDC050588]|uniref:hypothetical protein n=1 Tax=Dactylosporangium sp. NPDC050588 TaxID=3157211 RepID=UPI0033D375D0
MLNRHRRDEVRGYRALARTGVDPVQESHATRAEERTDAQRRSRKVARVLAKLPRRQRDVICMADAQKADCLLVDAATGRFAGGAWTGRGSEGDRRELRVRGLCHTTAAGAGRRPGPHAGDAGG